MPYIGSTEDRLAIRELIDAYGDAVGRIDADAWVECWAQEGVWLIRGNEIKGREALRAMWIKAMSAYKFVSFAGYPGDIHVTGDTATLRVHTTEWLTPHDGKPRRQHGIYEDRLVKEGGRWRFAQRSFTVMEMQEI